MMKVSVTVKREFMEEALDSTGAAKVTICLSESVLNENLSLASLPRSMMMLTKMWQRQSLYKYHKKVKNYSLVCRKMRKTSLPWWTSSLREERRCTGMCPSNFSWPVFQHIFFEIEVHITIRGYVDDPRNTDNAWMETVAFNFHDPSGQEVCFNEDKSTLGVSICSENLIFSWPTFWPN